MITPKTTVSELASILNGLGLVATVGMSQSLHMVQLYKGGMKGMIVSEGKDKELHVAWNKAIEATR